MATIWSKLKYNKRTLKSECVLITNRYHSDCPGIVSTMVNYSWLNNRIRSIAA